MTPKKGEVIPQTVENLQAIMAKDAETMEEQAKLIIQLEVKVGKLQQKLMKRMAE
jgi:hypothetical protein